MTIRTYKSKKLKNKQQREEWKRLCVNTIQILTKSVITFNIRNKWTLNQNREKKESKSIHLTKKVKNEIAYDSNSSNKKRLVHRHKPVTSKLIIQTV